MFVIGSDHGGYNLKDQISKSLKNSGYDVIDVGCHSEERCDYPDYAKIVSEIVVNTPESIGILICGTGIGISIAANKIKGVRCAVVNDIYTSKMAKAHNNANIIALGARILNYHQAINIIYSFIEEKFEEGRHINRINKIHQLEN